MKKYIKVMYNLLNILDQYSETKPAVLVMYESLWASYQMVVFLLESNNWISYRVSGSQTVRWASLGRCNHLAGEVLGK